MERFSIHVREKTTDKWQKKKDVSREQILAAVDGMMTDFKDSLRIKIFRN